MYPWTYRARMASPVPHIKLRKRLSWVVMVAAVLLAWVAAQHFDAVRAMVGVQHVHTSGQR